ncbi:hypothetical protein K491DRAFT_216757 [Lophiostoma macrostomum CBS 122681]|uniref:Uncharacterized protein n=1 Tax=Lophiostoma macrostomum CBS 122681 TaxID=1314788 RepID=A0A6A6TJM7_9PLEO|nr:hypothetical protein K491DRAFT_216757 [Lophiostoma macrostomum CBS 122681]
MSEGTGTSANRPVLPALAHVVDSSASKTSSTVPSPTQSTSSSLNPDAPTFKPQLAQKSSGLRATAQEFVPGRASVPLDDFTTSVDKKLTAMNLNVADTKVTSLNGNADVVDANYDNCKDSVSFVAIGSSANAIILNCTTKDMPKSTKVNDAVDKFVISKGHPHVVQLNILTGPRLPAISSVVEWFCESLGPYRAMIHHIQVVIIRCGEYISNNWTVPELDLENFDPLTHFVTGILQVVPHYAQITWGGSEYHCLNLRTQYFRKALPAAKSAFETEEHGIKEFSEAIDGKIMGSIAKRHAQVQGQKLEAQPEAMATTLTGTDGQQALYEDPFLDSQNAHVGKVWRGQADALVAPFAQQIPQPIQAAAYSQLNPHDPYIKQLKEVDVLRQKEWIHPANDMIAANGYGEAAFMRNQGDAFPQQMPAHMRYGQDMGGAPVRGFYGDNNGGYGPAYADEPVRGYGKKKNKKNKGGRGGYYNEMQDDAHLSRSPFSAGPGNWSNQQTAADSYNASRPNGADPYPYLQQFENPADYNNNGYYHNGFHSDGYGSGRGKKNYHNGERLHLKSDSKRGQPPQRRPHMDPQEFYEYNEGRQAMYHDASNGFDTRNRQHANSFASDRTVKAGANFAQRAEYEGNPAAAYEQRAGLHENGGPYAGFDNAAIQGQKVGLVGPDGVYGDGKPMEW